MKLILATHNSNKIKEIKILLPENFEIISLKELNFIEDIEETENTFHGNALLKAKYISESFNANVISDDSGLEVEILNNEPGVFSARYFSEDATDRENVEYLLKNLLGKENRKAKFISVICLILDGKEYFFEGEIIGEIAFEPKGTIGFGYDPVFIPENSNRTFAEMNIKEKNKYSHRAKAIEKLVDFLVRNLKLD
jgi:XTP/dITP diphosphohydrolase